MGKQAVRRHIELGVKGPVAEVPLAFAALKSSIESLIGVHRAEIGQTFELKSL
jgi:hypothetical protein